MKKMTFMACAAMLASAIAFTGCKSNDPTGPNSNDEDVVKTEFAISLPDQASNGAKHMPSTTVPASGTFYGMKNIVLIPFAKTSAIVSGDARLGNANISGLTDIAAGGLTTTGNAKRYENISIPLTTGSFLFYAESAPTTGTTDAELGKLTANNLADGTPATISFDLGKILGANSISSVTAANTKGDSLIAYLNSVAHATDGTTAWNAVASGGMKDQFDVFKTMHALSSYEVARVMSDLYTTLKGLPETPLIKAITDSIKVAKYASVAGSGPYTVTLHANLSGFPQNVNLPSGSVRIIYSGSAFVACNESQYTAVNQIPLDKYVYPSSLWYYANSTIKTANASMSAQYVDGKSWATILEAYTATGAPTTVNSQTRSVAIENPIQFATARLDVMVKTSSMTLEDNAGANIVFGSAIPVTGVLVGNQKSVGFDFKPSGSTQFTIYDNQMTNTVTASDADFSASNSNSTLVLETPATEENPGEIDATADVQIAVEFTNNSGHDFIGAAGQLIPKGGTFYLIAKLKASDASQTGKKVFAQDFTTTAKLTITNLHNAYNTIPDLRTPQLELGMSVDLTWQNGHEYAINFD